MGVGINGRLPEVAPLDRNTLKSIVEGLVFFQPEPLSPDTVAGVIQGTTVQEVQEILNDLEQEYLKRSRGFMLVRVAGGYQFRTLPDIAPWIQELKKVKPSRLSRAALETLSIIAYNQPVTRTQIEQIRGVESSGTIRSLIERDLVIIVGRKDVSGRPMLYGTSKRFLEVFGLPDLASLPPMPEIEAVEEGTE